MMAPGRAGLLGAWAGPGGGLPDHPPLMVASLAGFLAFNPRSRGFIGRRRLLAILLSVLFIRDPERAEQ
jgi:hypothetical protein